VGQKSLSQASSSYSYYCPSLPGSIDLDLENAVFFKCLPGIVKEVWDPRIIRVKE